MKSLKTIAFAACLSAIVQVSWGVTSNTDTLSSGDFTLQPPVLTARETPLVMLGLSVDNQLFYKAYTDYTDINSDGQLDTSYMDDFSYYGYFDNGWCYSYDTTNDVFSPSAASSGTNGHSCNGSTWSGNFLNWATMTRMDVLRRVLFGGLRSTDTSSATILERAYIPSDVHAFAKVYSGSDINALTPYASGDLTDGTLTICNVSSAHPYSASSVPQMRLAKGSYRRWSVNEGSQCQWDAGSNRPDSTDQLNNGSEHVVRVQACVTGKDEGSDDCKAYSAGSVKPVGLLQQYGETGELKFGLISGGYENYVSGGRLRKNIGLIGSNVDPADDEINLSTGQFNAVDGIISSVNSLHIIGWNGAYYNAPGVYDCGHAGISIASFKSKTFPCRDWGNPVSEIYAEAVRYFSGATSATAAYASGSDTNYIADLKDATWPGSLSVNPLNANTSCAACSIIMISSGVGSFDDDELSSVQDITGLGGKADLDTVTDSVGTAEYGAFPLSFLIGDDDHPGNGNDNLLCTSKSLGGLSEALGLCPEAPALQGSYAIAGLANHAKTTDLRVDTGMDGTQSVDTYGVELSESVPKFTIPVGSGAISFLPACESASSGNDWKPCSLFDVEVLKTEVDGSGNLISGTLLFHWEDSSWGHDYDLDGTQVISFCVGGSDSRCRSGFTDDRTDASYDTFVENGEIRITQAVAYSAADFNLRFGFVVTGSTDDGISSWLVRGGTNNRNDLCQLETEGDDGNPLMPIPNNTAAKEAGCISSQTEYAYDPVSANYSPSANAGASLLDRPLMLAAKYGGFVDLDGSGTPLYNSSTTDTREWDLVNNRTGSNGADGIPDNYFFSSNPGLLEGQLQRIFAALVDRTASGTNAAVVANTSSGIGAVYQALYQPKFSLGSQTVTWTGTLRGIFIDDAGRLREDSNGNAQLDGYSTDKAVEIFFDPALEKTFVQRYAEDATTGDLVADGQPVELSELKPIWSAVDRLAAASLPDEQRSTYAAVDTNRRYIFTALDLNSDGEVDEADTLNLLDSSLSSAYADYHEYFGLSDAAEAPNLVDFLRGKEVAGYRSRSIDYDQDGVNEVWRLGDIIHSTPAVVATPQESYGDLYSDTTYEAFVTQYRNRRQVVYVGANDGMIHAFNGGFWDTGSRAFFTQPNIGVANRPLGQEMWAYAPYNLLPHLRWLTEQDYQHVYYMDGEPLTFDANVFPDDATHPGGWGTILAVGMRFGGAPIEVAVGAGTKVMRSAYVLFDVTDPEQKPRLLGELTAPELGFTLAKPAVVNNRQPAVADDGTVDWDNPAANDWYLVLGSGPRGSNALSGAESDQTPRLFAIDLEQLVDNSYDASAAASPFTTIAGGAPLDLGGSNGYVGGIGVADWNNSNSDDALYVGTIEGTASSPVGRLHRILIDDNEGSSTTVYGVSGAQHSVMMNSGQPIQAQPITTRDNLGERWVLFGTGKLLVPSDNSLTAQQHFYGIKEPRDSSTGDLDYSTVSASSLVDTTDIAVFEGSGEVKDISSGSTSQLTIDSTEVDTFSELETTLQGYPGWKRRMQLPAGAPSGRVTGHATLNPVNRRQFAFTEYIPPAQSCDLDGESFLYALSIQTGTSTPDAPLSTSDDYVVNSHEMSRSVVSIGAGYASSVTFHHGGTGTLNAITNMSTGSISTTPTAIVVPPSGRQSWRQIDNLSF